MALDKSEGTVKDKDILSSAVTPLGGWPTSAFPVAGAEQNRLPYLIGIFERRAPILQAPRGFGSVLEEHGSIVLPDEVNNGTAGSIAPTLRKPRRVGLPRIFQLEVISLEVSGLHRGQVLLAWPKLAP